MPDARTWKEMKRLQDEITTLRDRLAELHRTSKEKAEGDAELVPALQEVCGGGGSRQPSLGLDYLVGKWTLTTFVCILPPSPLHRR